MVLPRQLSLQLKVDIRLAVHWVLVHCEPEGTDCSCFMANVYQTQCCAGRSVPKQALGAFCFPSSATEAVICAGKAEPWKPSLKRWKGEQSIDGMTASWALSAPRHEL